MGEDIFSMSNILDSNSIDVATLFQDDTEENNKEINTATADNQKETETTEVDPLTLFEDKPESVGSDETQDNQEKASSDVQEDDSSPNTSVYSSIAKACFEDDVFPDLEESDITSVKDADDFRELLEKQINARLDAVQKRVHEALDNGVEPTEVQQYERTLSFLHAITEDNLAEESDQGEDLRKRIIFQDFVNKGFSKERAQREVKKSVDNGTDIEDAKDALESNKEFFGAAYTRLQEQAKAAADKIRQERAEEAQALKTSIEEDDYLGDISLDKKTRKKVIDNLSKFKYKDKQTGESYTELQKYEKEHKADFLKYVATLFTMTNGFKDFSAFVKTQVTRENNKSIKELEKKLTGNTHISDGNLSFMGNGGGNDSLFGKGWKLDV